MKRIISSVLLIAGLCAGASAAPVTPAEALQRARTSGSKKLPAAAQQQMTLAHTFSTESGAPAVYVFDQPANSGYLILSADDLAVPVLGYADNGKFDYENMPPQMKWWLEQYADQIAYAAKNNITPAKVETRAQAAVAPLLKSKWNQSAPYNDLCPMDPNTNKRCVTGCVATAMAQVMNYWKYPEAGAGVANYRPSGFLSNLTMDFSQTKFDWANMLDTYVTGQYNSTQSTAVATLMKACGYSCQMGYSSSASGAVSYNMGKALINNFKYNSNATYEQRNYYSTTEWNNMVYNEVAAGRPVLYGGQSAGGGHQFVCDGYNDGFYHINWGWGGMSDGYFKLESLNPDSEGIGGGSGGYNYSQDVMVGVQPTAATNPYGGEIVQNGSITGTASGTRVTLSLTGGTDNGWWNWGFYSINVQLSMAISPVDNPNSVSYATCLSQSLGARSGFRSLNFTFPSTLANGKYICKLVTKNASVSNAEWHEVRHMPGASTSMYITKSGSTLTVENIAAASLSIAQANISGDLYYRCVSKIAATFKNESEYELNATIIPRLVNASGSTVFQSESFAISLVPGETLDKTWETVFELASGATAPTSATQYYLVFIDQNTGKNYGIKQEVTMNVASCGPSILNFTLTGCSREQVGSYYNVYIVPDPAHINTSFSLRNTTGYYGYPTYICITDYASGYIQKLVSVPNVGMKTGIVPFKVEVSFDEAEEDVVYGIGVAYLLDNKYSLLNMSTFTPRRSVSGVNDIVGNEFEVVYDKGAGAVVANGEVAQLQVFDISGKQIAGTVEEIATGKQFVLGDGFSGVAVVKAVSASGEVRTLKIVK